MDVFAELKSGMAATLETYSNVHRGSGHNSLVSTSLFEQARTMVLEYLGLKPGKYQVIFCSPRRAELLKARLKPGTFYLLSSQEFGLPVGLRALVVRRSALPAGVPFQAGGGTARLVAPDWVVWAKAPDKFEAGTPPVVNVIAFARALQLARQYGKDAFAISAPEKLDAASILYHDGLDQYSGEELLEKFRQTLVGQRTHVPTLAGLQPYINLDNAASTPTFAPIWDAFCQAWQQPASVQHDLVHETGSICAEVLGAPASDYDVIFASNTTEAINLAAESLGKEAGPDGKFVVVNTLLEHNSNELPWRLLTGAELVRLPVDAQGFVDLNELELLLRAYNREERYGALRVKLVAVSGASNVLGVYNDLAGIGRVVHRYGARLLVDGAQMVAHRKVDMAGLGIDYFAFSAHKVYAPFGSGALVVRKGLLRFSPAELELIRSSGAENVGGIAALGKALLLLQRIGLELIQADEQALTRRALSGLAAIPGLTLYGLKDAASPRFAQKGGVIAFNLKGSMAPQTAQALAERRGIGVRAGCHCAHLLVKRLVGVGPRLEQFQRLIVTLFPQLSLPGVARISLGIENTAEDVDELLRVLGEIAREQSKEAGQPAAPKSPDVRRQIDDFTRAAGRKVYALPR